MPVKSTSSPKTYVLIHIALGLSNIFYSVLAYLLSGSPRGQASGPPPSWGPMAVYANCAVDIIYALVFYNRNVAKYRQALSEGDTSQTLSLPVIGPNAMIESASIVALMYFFMYGATTPLYIVSTICTVTSLGVLLPKVIALAREAELGSSSQN